MKIIIFKYACELEKVIKENELDYYDKIIGNRTDENAISFFEKNYPEYCDIIEVPEDATDYTIIDHDNYIDILIARNNKIECIYSKYL